MLLTKISIKKFIKTKSRKKIETRVGLPHFSVPIAGVFSLTECNFFLIKAFNMCRILKNEEAS
jgi:hypothetical protein